MVRVRGWVIHRPIKKYPQRHKNKGVCAPAYKHTSTFTTILTDEGLEKANKRNGAILVLGVAQRIQYLPHILSTVINATLKRGRDGCC